MQRSGSLRRRAALRRALGLVATLACAAGDSAAPDETALAPCPSPRPEQCTRIYQPACGHRCANPPCEAGRRRTYGNACDACIDPAVTAVAPGSCEGGAREEPPLLR